MYIFLLYLLLRVRPVLFNPKLAKTSPLAAITKTDMKIFLGILLLLLLIISCRKPIPENIQYSASGFVMDTVKNKYLDKATVEVFGCKLTFYGLSCGDSVASVLTDKNGYFSLKFITNGKFYSYSIGVKPMTNDNYVHDYSINSNLELKKGENNNILLKARELNFLQERLKIDQNPYDTLMIYNTYDQIIFYNQHHIDTILYFKVFPQVMNYFYYYNWDSKILKERRQILDSVEIKMADTTYYTKHISNLVININ